MRMTIGSVRQGSRRKDGTCEMRRGVGRHGEARECRDMIGSDKECHKYVRLGRIQLVTGGDVRGTFAFRAFPPFPHATRDLSGGSYAGPAWVLFVCTWIPFFVPRLSVFALSDNVLFVHTLFGSHITHLVYSLPSPGRRSSNLLSLDLLCQVCT